MVCLSVLIVNSTKCFWINMKTLQVLFVCESVCLVCLSFSHMFAETSKVYEMWCIVFVHRSTLIVYFTCICCVKNYLKCKPLFDRYLCRWSEQLHLSVQSPVHWQELLAGCERWPMPAKPLPEWSLLLLEGQTRLLTWHSRGHLPVLLSEWIHR